MNKTVLAIGLAATCGAAYFWNQAGRESPSNPLPRSISSATSSAIDGLVTPRVLSLDMGNGQQRPTAALAAALPIPETGSADQAAAAEIELWSPPHADDTTDFDGIPAWLVRVDPDALRGFMVGQTLFLNVDTSGTRLAADLTATYNDPQGVKVWQGTVKDALPGSSLVIAQGETQTHVLVTSEQGTYSAVIDNLTGEASIVDEGALMAGQASFDDAIPIAAFDDTPLPLGN